MAQNNYTLGRGKVRVARYEDGVLAPDAPFRYIGNTPEFSLTIESETLDHFSSDEGIREKDDSVPLEVNRTGSLTTDNISPENVALFFFGDSSVVTTAAAGPTTMTIGSLELDRSYKIGRTPSNPGGVFGIDPATTTVTAGGTELVAGTDYELDADNGMLHILESAENATGGEEVEVSYSVLANTRSRVISGSDPVECAMIYESKNPKGADFIFYMPYVKITPNGDYALKGDEWQQIPLSLEILKLANAEAIYRDGKPAYTS